jgi:hypothetical protein
MYWHVFIEVGMSLFDVLHHLILNSLSSAWSWEDVVTANRDPVKRSSSVTSAMAKEGMGKEEDSPFEPKL